MLHAPETKRRPRVAPIVIVLTILALLGVGFVSTAGADQNPPLCTDNNFRLDIQQTPSPPYTDGQLVTYTVRYANLEPAGGCNTSGVVIDLTLPTGASAPGFPMNIGFVPFGTVSTVAGSGTYNVNFAANGVPCGPTQCVVARARATGLLHINPVPGVFEPFLIEKQVSGSPAVQVGRHFFCYEVRRDNPTAGTGSVVDQFGVSNLTISHPHMLCNPADKNDEDPNYDPKLDPEHYVGWELKSIGNLPAQGKRVLMTNQFGTAQAFQLTGPGLLKMPAAKQPDINGPAPTPLVNPSIDQLMCYSARGAANVPGGTSFVPVKNVKVRDQFGTVFVNVEKIYEICVPADVTVNGNLLPSLPNTGGQLTCYSAKLANNMAATYPQFVETADQISALTAPGFRTLKIDRVWTLCVPSTLQTV